MTILLRVSLCVALAIVAALALEKLQGNGIVATIIVIAIACICSVFLAEWLPGESENPQNNEKPPAKPGKKSNNQEQNEPSGPREQGVVKWFNYSKGYGFITRDNGEDLFVHFRSIQGSGRRVLNEGQSVEYTVTEGDKGLQADSVRALD